MAGGPTQSGVAGGLSEMRSEVQEVDDQLKRSEVGGPGG